MIDNKLLSIWIFF